MLTLNLADELRLRLVYLANFIEMRQVLLQVAIL